jgi:hypothetical protein
MNRKTKLARIRQMHKGKFWTAYHYNAWLDIMINQILRDDSLYL